MDLATHETVLGDFDNATFEHFGIVSRFFRKEGKFYVHTQGPNGEMGDFKIAYTFGFYPLQQYLVPFPGGRLQCLPIAWDDREKKWYHLYPDAALDPKDWLYWTNAGQNWNGMCAECHSTNLRKNYNLETATYQTTWSDMDVGCEACHGPGSLHVKWAELPVMGRPPSPNYELVVRTAGMNSWQQVELCAPCHSRRMSLGDNTHDIKILLDYAVPQLLSEGMYFADGQILEEVYVYGSFIQSKMHDRDVRCSDCHDVHSIKRIKEGNDLCLQCHRGDIYDTHQHHFHKKKGEKGEPIRSAQGKVLFDVGTGAVCVECHMPGRNYMGIDYRPDHSFRVPRPDLSITIGTPNACNRCHMDKEDKWSVEYMTKWYGTKYKPHYGTALHAGRKGLPKARQDLIRLSGDRLYPVIVRATALFLLGSYSGEEVAKVYERALSDEEPLMRQTAVRNLHALPPKKRIGLIVPLLYDPAKAVRIEAANKLAVLPRGQLTGKLEKRYQAVLNEYRQAMEYTADFAASQHNLGNLYSNLGQLDEALKAYQAAIRIDDHFYPAKVNLAMVYNQVGKNREAEGLLREVVQAQPRLHEVQYSLGLLLAERKNYEEASLYLSMAARGLPNRARVHYNLGLLLDYLQKDLEAEAALLRALDLDSGNLDFLNALAQFYMKRDKYQKAKPIAEQMIARHPSNRLGHNLLSIINREIQGNK
jgi:tetratricopeptide (TPR) repeat protein